ncbi:MAG: ParB/RepB/Spo0J family partition protein [Desulfonatronovibrionaceae bacterium]
MKISDKGLGKGLDALIKPDFYESSAASQDITSININKISPNPDQPRKNFSQEGLNELTESIKNQGVLQPILVRKTDEGNYQIIAGERRWRASQTAGLSTIPALVREYSDQEVLAIALIENLQREDLNPMEQARALYRLKNELNINQDQLAERIGKSRSHLANILRLTSLPEELQVRLEKKQISSGHARALLGLKDKSRIREATEQILARQLSVRATENLIKKMNQPEAHNKQSAQTDALLREALSKMCTKKINPGLKVKFKGNKDQGQLIISYDSREQLKDMLKVLGTEEVPGADDE